MQPTPHLFFKIVAGIFAFSILFQCASAQTSNDDNTTALAIEAFNKGQEAHENGDLSAAIAQYDRALELIPQFPEAELQKGAALAAAGRPAEAERSYRKALEYRPDWTLAMTGLGSFLVVRERFAEAEQLLERAVAVDSQNSLAYSALADLRLRTNADRAVLQKLLGQIAKLTAKANPTAALIASQAALEFALEQNSADATAERALALDPRNKTALSVSFDAALKRSDTVAARALYQRLESIDKNSRQLVLLNARLLAAEGNLTAAIAVIDAGGAATPAEKAFRETLLVQTASDAPTLESKLAADPQNLAVLGRLCVMLRVENPQKAAEFCRRASAADPSNLSHAVGYGAALVQATRYADAVSLLRKVVTAAPENATARANLATALFQLKMYREAIAEFRWLTDRQPATAAAYFFLGVSFDRLGEYMDAMANYQQFLKVADVQQNGLEIEKVKLRIPLLDKEIKKNGGKRRNADR